MLGERGQLTVRPAAPAFAILLFQDLAVIPAIVAAAAAVAGPAATRWAGGRSRAACGGSRLLVAGRRRCDGRAPSGARAQEVFTAAALLVVIGAALLIESIGLSMALGAFLAGVLLADSEFRHELEADVEPFKGLLLGLFFMVVGMTANST